MSKELTDFLKKIVPAIKQEGREKGLTKKEADQRKNLHWDDLYSYIVRFVGFILVIAILWILYMIIIFSVHLWEDYTELKTTLESTIKYIAAGLATLGTQSLLEKLRPPKE